MSLQRVVMNQRTIQNLGDYIVKPNHELLVYSLDDRTDRVTLENGEFRWNEVGRETSETKKVECSCGYETETLQEAKKHLKNPESEPSIKSTELREILDGVNIHGFEFGGLDAHGSSIFFTHQTLGIRIYATPLKWLTGEEDTLQIQVDGESDTVFTELNGKVVENIEFDSSKGMTYQTYLKELRNYIESNIVKNHWKNEKTDKYRSRWDNQHNKSFSLVVEELEDSEEKFGLFELDGINKTPLDKGGNPEIWNKAITYMNENPLAKTLSYRQVIEDSEYEFKGQQEVNE